MRNIRLFLILFVILLLGIGSAITFQSLSNPEEYPYAEEDPQPAPSKKFSTVFLESNLNLTWTDYVFVLDEEDYRYTDPLYILPGTYQYRAEVEGFLPITGTLQVGAEDQILNLYFAKYDNLTFVARGRHPVWSPDGKRLAYRARGTVYIMDIAAGHTECVELPFEDPNFRVLGWAGNEVVVVQAPGWGDTDIAVSATAGAWAVLNSEGTWLTEKISDNIIEWSGDFTTGTFPSETAEIGLAPRQDRALDVDLYTIPRDLHSTVVSGTGKYIAGIIPEDYPGGSGFLVDGLLQVYSSSSGTYIQQDKANIFVAGKLEFSPCEKYLAYLVEDKEGQHLVVDDLTGSTVRMLKNAGMAWTWSDCGNRLLWVHDGETIMLEDLATGQQTALLQLDEYTTKPTFIDDNRIAYIVNRSLYVYNLESHENVLIDDNEVSDISVSPTRDLLVYLASSHIVIAKPPSN